MQTLHDLYVQNPFWVWLAVGAVFIALDIASGSGKLIWGGVAAAVLALVNLTEVRLGAPIELLVFVAIGGGGAVLSLMPWKAKPTAATPHDKPAPVAEPKGKKAEKAVLPEPPAADELRTARLIGRIGRTTGEFANGVGRVWIDGAEWGAELDGEETLPSDTPVRVLGVTGGVRLQVRHLMAN